MTKLASAAVAAVLLFSLPQVAEAAAKTKRVPSDAAARFEKEGTSAKPKATKPRPPKSLKRVNPAAKQRPNPTPTIWPGKTAPEQGTSPGLAR